MIKNIKKKVAVNSRSEIILRIPKALVDLTSIKNDTEMEFLVNKKGLLEIKQVAK